MGLPLIYLYREIRRQDPAPRLFRERVDDLDKVTGAEFFQHTRMYPAHYRELHDMLLPHISPRVPTNNAIPSNTRLQGALSYLTSGDNLRSSGKAHGVSTASASRHLTSTVDAIMAEVG